jgi:uncharacterized protein with ACT and thioredoxin-like domain
LSLRGSGARKERGHETRGEEKLSVHGAWDYMIQRLMSAHAILCSLADRPGMLSALTKVLADHQANITYVDIHPGKPAVGIYFEFTVPDHEVASTLADLRAVAGVEDVSETPSFSRIYGKRIIVMGDRWQWVRSRKPIAITSVANVSRWTRFR